MTSSASADLDIVRASALLESDPASAAAQASEILANFPQHEAAALLFAAAQRCLGDAAAALGMMQSLSAAQPASATLQLETGRTFAAAGRTQEATAAFKCALELNPQLAEGWRELATQYFAAGETASGDAAYRAYSRLAHDPPALIDALVAVHANRLDAADAMVRQVLREKPRNPDAWRLLALISQQRGDPIEAERCFNACLDAAPGDAASREDLAKLLHEQERSAEALPHIERLLAMDPADAGYLLLKVQALRPVGRSREALEIMRQLLGRSSDPNLWVIFGNLQRELGHQSGAIDAYRYAIGIQPGFSEAYWALANLKTFQFTDADVAAMHTQLAASPAAGLEFALGKALEDRGEYPQAFVHYDRGNAKYRAGIEYDAEATTVYTQRSMSTFTREFFTARAGWGSERRDPIFIVGMPRSGSTLLEQILASHSQIEGTRELPDVPLIAQQLAARSGVEDPVEYPERVGLLSKRDVEAFAQKYLAATVHHRPGNLPRFIDKMLGNFSHLALIELMFPRAVIIDARRHPIGCTFSCFKQHFSRGMNFSYEQRELGRYYRDYARLMAHFDEALPGRIYRVHYERLVADPQGEVRRLLEHCGLRWEEACLRFHENRRVVQTISSEQVRRPLYADSVDQWRHFETWLTPLREELAELIAQYPAP